MGDLNHLFEQPDLSTDITDNGRLNVAVLALNDSSRKTVNEISSFLRTLPPFQPGHTDGSLSLRVLTSLPYWAKEEKGKSEGTLNGSKKIYCLLCVAMCGDADDLTNALSAYRNKRELIYNQSMTSRCLIYGNAAKLHNMIKGQDGFVLINVEKRGDSEERREEELMKTITHCVTVVYSNLTILLSHKKNQKKGGSLPHSLEGTAVDEEQISRQHARSIKAQGDSYLLLGQFSAALKLYNEALLRHQKDNLWLGATIEGILSANILKQRNVFLQDTICLDISLLSEMNCTTKSSELHDGPSDKDRHSSLSDSDQRNSSFSSEREVKEGSHGSSEVTSYNSSEGTELNSPDGPSSIMGEGKMEKDFQLAINYYSKAGYPGRKPLFELYIKYAGYLIHQENYHAACHQLVEAQNVLSSDVEILRPLKLSMYLTLSRLYHQMKLKRKTLFMMFSAGKQAIELANHVKCNADLKLKAYDILSHCLKEFGISCRDGSHQQPLEIKGWPFLQAVLLIEYINLCKELEYHEVVIRWGWLLLQTFHIYLSPCEIRRVAEFVSNAAKTLRASNAYDGHVDEVILAPFPMSSIPCVTVFKPQPLAPELHVKQSVTLFPSLMDSSTTEGPFLFSAIGKKRNQNEVLWVQGDPAEVVLVVSNPLPVEIKVEKMTLILEGAKVKLFPSNIALPSNSEPQQFVLLCIPDEPGHLALTGYKANVLDLLNESTTAVDNNIRVLPSLPQLRAKVIPRPTIFSPSAISDINLKLASPYAKGRSLSTIDYFELLDGEVCDCDFQLQSIGDVAIDEIKLIIKDQSADYCTLTWEASTLQSLLPMTEKNKYVSFPLRVAISIPHSLRVGPCKPDELHVQSLVLRRLSKQLFLQQVPRDTPKSKKLAPNRTSFTDVKELLGMSASHLGSPSRRKKMNSSYRKSKDDQFHDSPKSDLFESLDLPDHPSFSHQLNRKQNIVDKPTDLKPLEESPVKRKLLPSTPRNNTTSGSPSSSVRFKNRFKKPSDTSSVPLKPSRPIPIHVPNDRLMDSLNLDFPLASDLRHKIDNNSRQSNLSDTTTDTISELDSPSSDKVSIKSDPGSSSPLPFSIPTTPPTSPLPFQLRSSTLQTSIFAKDKRGNSMEERKLGWSSHKKKRVTVQSSLPIQGKSFLASTLPKAPGLPTIFSPAERPKNHPPDRKKLNTVFLLQYTGGEGAKEGYYREVTVSLTLTIRPTLYFEDFGIAPVKGSADLFSFVFTMENISPYTLHVTCDVKQDGPFDNHHSWVLESVTSREVSIPMLRFILVEYEATLKEADILKPYCDHLVSLLDIRWSAPLKNKCGNVSLSGLKLPQSVVAIIRPLPVLFNYKTEAISYSPGKPVVINVEVTNNTGSLLPISLITLSPFTMTPSGGKVDCAETNLVMYSQSLAQKLPELAVDTTYKFALNMVFMSSNEYFIDVKLHKSLPLEQEEIMKTENQDDNKETEINTKSETVFKHLNSENSSSNKKEVCNLIVSPVFPNTRIGTGNPTTSPSPVSMVTHPVCKDANRLGNIKEFISHSRTYAGPQLTIKIL